MGTPEAMYNDQSDSIWSCELNSYGKVRNFKSDKKADCPFRYQGQYEDVETGLYYNRFRYYSPNEGMYLSQDPIGLDGGLNLYSYVGDPNLWVDIFGLTGTYMFNDGKTFYIGKGPASRMEESMKQRIGGKANATQGLHMDLGDDKIGLMVEAELMRRNNAVTDTSYANAINSPGEKLLVDAQKNNVDLYNDIQKKANDFENKYNNQKGKGTLCV